MKAKPSEPGGSAALTDSGISHVYACVSVGASLKDAAEYVGVPVSVIRARRRADPAFARGLHQAIHKGKVHHLNKISKSSAWQASAWLLERRWRRQFGRNQPGAERAVKQVEAYDWGRLTVEQQRQLIAFFRLALLTRAEIRKANEVPADSGGAAGRDLPAPPAGADRRGPVSAEPA
jgi:hypothetical protein